MRPFSPDIRGVMDAVLAAVARGEKVYVEGPIGAGRNLLVERLRTEHGAIALELLPVHEVDAPALAFIELAAALPSQDRPRMVLGSDDEYHRLAATICTRLADDKRPIVVRLPASWAGVFERADDDSRVATDARAWFEGVTATDAPIIVVADSAITPKQLGLHRWRVLRLPPHRVPLGAFDTLFQGNCEAAFAALRGAVSPERRESPLAWRLAVGVVALGGHPTQAVSLLDTAPPLRALSEELGRLAALDEPVAKGIRAVLAIRRPMESAAFVKIAAPPTEHVHLFTQCIGYGVETIRIAGPVRVVLRDVLTAGAHEAQVHRDLAAHYRALDGATSPWALPSQAVRAWSEKVHHISRCGEEGAEEWLAQELIAPEQYWERARTLSLAGRYREAADLYARCTAKFPEDDYAWHYLAWNKQHAREDRETVERSYREAVKLSPENPWWNSRLVTFLVEDGQPGRARAEWEESIARVDADGEELTRSPWLARHMHRWVAEAWLNAGRASRAAAVMRQIPDVYRNEKLRRLARRIREADPNLGREDPTWSRFLHDGPARLGMSTECAENLRSTWRQLREIGGADLPLPFADRTADGERVLFCWSYASVLLEIEIEADGTTDWFALDRNTQKCESGDGHDFAALRPWLRRVTDG